MGTLGGPDVWKIGGDERTKHDQQFFSLKPINGLISGEQARGYFLQSGLPSAVLAQIWNLADLNKDGKMDKKEFSIAIHLIQKKLQGFSLPTTLPDSMKLDPQPVIGTFGAPGAFAPNPMPVGMLPGGGGWPAAAPMGGGFNPQPPMGYGGITAPSPTIAVRAKTDWSMPQHTKLKYSQTFNNIDKSRTGFLTGVHARNILSQTGLPNPILAQIWNLSDVDRDGRLSCDEFCIAMHLIDMVNAGETLPSTLPPEMTSFMRQRNASIGSLDDDEKTAEEKLAFARSFEDRRKENFDRGQAELERRRQILFDQEKREREERERKDREEFEKHERERLEMERRRQLEMEKQMARQREEQQKREDEYRKVIEQREAARRELEKQRQVELERQRVQELMVLRQQEQESVCHLKQKHKNLNFQFQALNEKSNDINNQITEVRERIVAITSSIEGMKRDRDSKVSDMEMAKRQTQEINIQLARAQSDKQMLHDRRMQVGVGGGGGSTIGDSYTQVMHTYRNKSMNLDSLRQSLLDIERNIETRNTASKDREKQLHDLAAVVQNELCENQELCQRIAKCQEDVIKLAPHKASYLGQRQSSTTSASGAWPPAFEDNAAWGTAGHQAGDDWAASTHGDWPTTNGQMKNSTDDPTVKYRAVYEFSARSEDELSFQPGDIILVFKGHVGEPGWLAGQIKDKVGWFPEAFAECVESPTGNAGNQVLNESPSRHLSTPKLECINEESFDKDDEHRTRQRGPTTNKQKNGAPVERQKAMAQFQWKGKKDDHLSFNKGDIITVVEMQEMWWLGELDGKSGWFPKSYVKIVDGERRKSELSAGSALKSNEVAPSKSQEFPSQAITDKGGQWFVACYPFPEMEPGDLQFDSGERIFVIKQDGEWWTGRCNGREGMFPANYVQPITEEAVTTPGSIDQQPAYSTVQKKHAPFCFYAAPRTSNESTKQPSIEVTTPTDTAEGLEIGKVIAPYTAVEANQLTLDAGDLIKIRSKSPTGWWEGELQKKGQDKKIGWFPADYVKIIKKGDATDKQKSSDSVSSLAAGASATDGANHDVDAKETVMVMFDYTAQLDDELSLNRGDVLVVTEKVDAEWWKGEMANGQHGLFPASYVQPYAGVNRALQQEQHRGFQEKQALEQCERKQSTPTVDYETEPTHSNGNGNSQTTETKNNKRNMYCQELLQTELNYLDDLQMVKDVFCKQFVAANCLTGDEMNTLFVNWDDLIRVSKMFGKTLRQYGEERVGRATLESMKHLRAFVTFCQYQQSSLEFLEAKLKSSPQFQACHAQCAQHLAARGLPLSHFLLIPMTRVTKYPLVFKEIIKYTPDDHTDRESLQNALTALKELCDEVNRVATETDNLQMLYWCQNHVKCESIQPKFVFHSATNFLGPRKFLHFGVLFKAKSNRLLIGLLFNDVLLLTTPDEAIDHPDSFKLNRTSDLVLSLYKQPILLHKASLQMAPSLTGVDSGDETLLALNNGELTISFKAVSSNARLLWTKQLEKAIKNVKLAHAQVTQAAAAAAPNARTKTAIGRLLMEIVVLRNLNIPIDCKSLPTVVEMMFSDQKSTKVVDLSRNETPLCSTQFVIDAKTNLFSMAVYAEQLYAPNLCLGKAELQLADMMKMSGLQRNPAMKQLPLLTECNTANGAADMPNQQVIIKFVVQMFDD